MKRKGKEKEREKENFLSNQREKAGNPQKKGSPFCPQYFQRRILEE
jgi:hypothetical protein